MPIQIARDLIVKVVHVGGGKRGAVSGFFDLKTKKAD